MRYLLVLLATSTVWAALPWEPEFSWTFPTEYESGAPLDVSQIMDIDGAESGPSNSVNFTVPADRAVAPALNVN